MEPNAVMSKTGRGVLQIKYRSQQLPDDQYRVLRMIDGKTTLRELAKKSTINEASLLSTLQTLVDDGFIREIPAPHSGAGSHSAINPMLEPGNNLDFTHYFEAKA